MAGEYGTRKDGRIYPRRLTREEYLKSFEGLSKNPIESLRDDDFYHAYCNEGYVHRVSPDVARGLIRSGRFEEVGHHHLQQVSKGLCILVGKFGHTYAGTPTGSEVP